MPDGSDVRAKEASEAEIAEPTRVPATREAVTNATPAAPPISDRPAGQTPTGQTKRKRGLLRPLLMIGGILIVAVGAFYAYLTGGRYVSTDDAYVQADKVGVTTDISGIVKEVLVREGEEVTAGQILFRLDPQPFRIALERDKAKLAQIELDIQSMKADYQRMLNDIAAAEATVQLDQAQYDRYRVLARSQNASQATYDQARFKLLADQKTVDSLKQQAASQLARLGGNPDIPVEQHPQYQQAKAAVDEDQRQLDHTVVRAPFAGIVSRVDALQPGAYLAASTQAFSLVAADHVWIEGNPKETDLTHVTPGQKASVVVDTYPGKTWEGTVESISPASGAEFSLLPAQNSSGNWVKVVQRIPVRIKVDRRPGDPVLRSGMSATIEIDTEHHRSLSDLL